MKKLIAIAAILVLIPFTAFGLERVSDETMNDFTAQAGVSIGFDLLLNIDVDTLAWGDTDGLAAGDTGAWVGAIGYDADASGSLDDAERGLHIDNLHLRLRGDMAGNTGANAGNGRSLWDLELLTIDVATNSTYVDPVTLAADPTATQSYVRIGLGTADITMDWMSMNVGIAPDLNKAPDFARAQKFGVVNLYNLQVLTGGGRVDIFPHGGSGVTLDLDIIIDSITMAALSWGDTDGIGAIPINGFTLDGGDYTNAGYVGFANVDVRNVTAVGQVLIDVATLDATAIAGTPIINLGNDPVLGVPVNVPGSYLLTILSTWLNNAAADAATGSVAGTYSNYVSNTFVLIQLGDTRNVAGAWLNPGKESMTVHLDSFTADVAISDQANLGVAQTTSPLTGAYTRTNPTDVMGSVYMSNLNVTAQGWVGIWAH